MSAPVSSPVSSHLSPDEREQLAQQAREEALAAQRQGWSEMLHVFIASRHPDLQGLLQQAESLRSDEPRTDIQGELYHHHQAAILEILTSLPKESLGVDNEAMKLCDMRKLPLSQQQGIHEFMNSHFAAIDLATIASGHTSGQVGVKQVCTITKGDQVVGLPLLFEYTGPGHEIPEDWSYLRMTKSRSGVWGIALVEAGLVEAESPDALPSLAEVLRCISTLWLSPHTPTWSGGNDNMLRVVRAFLRGHFHDSMLILRA
jgi:hypothetical protein